MISQVQRGGTDPVIGRAVRPDDFPTPFPTELLNTGWEVAGLDGW
jgi:hypothetical protein